MARRVVGVSGVKPLSDAAAMNLIVDVLNSSAAWTSETVAAVADLLRMTGRVVRPAPSPASPAGD